jgi:hypothetical protein
MKKLFFLLVILVSSATTFVSCTDEVFENQETETSHGGGDQNGKI